MHIKRNSQGLLCASAGALLFGLGCSDPEEPIPEGLVTMRMVQDVVNYVGRACPFVGTPFSIPDGVAPINETTSVDEVINNRDKAGNRNVTCKVQETSDGVFSVSASVKFGQATEFRMDPISLTGTTTSGPTRILLQYRGETYMSTQCTFTADASGGQPALLEPRNVKASFSCTRFENGSQQGCDFVGTLFLYDCGK